MTGIDKITKRIQDDAQQEIAATLAAANTEADSIRARYEAQATREQEEALRRGKEQAAERLRNLEGAAQLESRKRILAAKQRMLDLAFMRAEKTLAEMSGEPYLAFLSGLAANAAMSGKEQIILSAADAAAYGDAVCKAANALLTERGKPASLTLSEEQRETGGGLIVKEGDIETNCTFDTILRLQRPTLSSEVAKTLFP